MYSVHEVARGTDDLILLAKAHQEDWILISNDKDFGDRVFRDQLPHHGIVLLRLRDERPAAKVSAIEKLLASHADELHDRFVVVTELAVRFSPVS